MDNSIEAAIVRAMAKLFGDGDPDACLVAQIMEIDHRHRLAMAKITGFELKHQGDLQYLARCREARKKITANTDQKKQEALAAWWPSFARPEIQSTTH